MVGRDGEDDGAEDDAVVDGLRFPKDRLRLMFDDGADEVLWLDRALARLLAHLEERIGLKRVLLVLSADHGFDRMPESYAAKGLTAGRLRPNQMAVAANARLAQRFGVETDLVRGFFNPSFYLDESAIAAAGLQRAAVEDALVELLEGWDGVARAVSRSTLEGLGATHDPLLVQLARSFHRQRSGHVILVQEPFWYLYPADYSAMHGSPWRYDAHVPLAFAGIGVSPGRVDRVVHPTAAAPTIAALLGISAPAASVGEPLLEVLARERGP